MKKEYIKPNIDIVLIEDIITTSGLLNDPNPNNSDFIINNFWD